MHKQRIISTWSRIILTIVLLVIVWLHAHWSVALCLALQAIAIELLVEQRRPPAGRIG